MSVIRAELLKYKRTFMKKLIVLSPLFFGVYAGVMALLMDKSTTAWEAGNVFISWRTLLTLVFNWWPFIFLSLGMALFSVLAAAQEKKAGDYRALLSRDVKPVKIWIGKITGMAVTALLAAVVLIFVVIISGIITAKGSIPAGEIISAALLCWIATLPLIPLQLWAATWKGMIFSMGIGFAGMAAGALAAPESYWVFCPWSYALRMMCPVVGVHPNGTYLPEGSALLNGAVIPAGMILAAAVFVILTAVTGMWFQRREVR